jgi:integrase
MDTVRVFVRWLESIDGVQQDLSTKVLSPVISAREHARGVRLEPERAEAIFAYLRKYQYASVQHVSLYLLWHTMMRIGGAHALDLRDYHSDEEYLEVRHRPKTKTPLKNKDRGERLVALSEETCELLDDWIADRRPDLDDEYGRSPLLTSRTGRLAPSTIRRYVYQWTRPCHYGQGCPHDRDLDDCIARQRHHESKCPSTVSPHAIRRGSITHALNQGVPEEVVSDRANVSSDVLEAHYDRRSEREKMEQRREYLSNI